MGQTMSKEEINQVGCITVRHFYKDSEKKITHRFDTNKPAIVKSFTDLGEQKLYYNHGINCRETNHPSMIHDYDSRSCTAIFTDKDGILHNNNHSKSTVVCIAYGYMEEHYYIHGCHIASKNNQSEEIVVLITPNCIVKDPSISETTGNTISIRELFCTVQFKGNGLYGLTRTIKSDINTYIRIGVKSNYLSLPNYYPIQSLDELDFICHLFRIGTHPSKLYV